MREGVASAMRVLLTMRTSTQPPIQVHKEKPLQDSHPAGVWQFNPGW